MQKKISKILHLISSNSFIRYSLLALLGVLATFALPPYFIFPLLIISFSLFPLLLQTAKNIKQSFWTGWWFGFGHFISGLYWIANSLLVDAERFAWMIPFAISLIPAALAIYIGLVSVFTYLLSKYVSGWRLVCIFSCIWVAAEMIRTKLFTGFPWNLTGYSWNFSDIMIQIASVSGVYGLSLLAVITASMPAIIITSERKKTILPFAILVVTLSSIFAFGFLRLLQTEAETKHLTVRIVQPNIAQTLKWSPEHEQENLSKLIKLTEEPPKNTNIPELIIWPEAGVVRPLNEDSSLRKALANIIPEKSLLLTGSVRIERGKDESYKIWNSAQLLDHYGNIVANYDKHHLVPFGEFVPFRTIFPFINKITPGSTDFSSGPGPLSISANSVIPAISPLICYEDIFPSEVADKNNPPAIMANLTNDGWFGDSSGPHQHFEMSRIRAVEEGIPLLRSANTGVSGVINNKGVVVNKLGINKSGIIDETISYETSIGPRTLYASYGNIIPIILISLLAIITLSPIKLISRAK